MGWGLYLLQRFTRGTWGQRSQGSSSGATGGRLRSSRHHLQSKRIRSVFRRFSAVAAGPPPPAPCSYHSCNNYPFSSPVLGPLVQGSGRGRASTHPVSPTGRHTHTRTHTQPPPHKDLRGRNWWTPNKHKRNRLSNAPVSLFLPNSTEHGRSGIPRIDPNPNPNLNPNPLPTPLLSFFYCLFF